MKSNPSIVTAYEYENDLNEFLSYYKYQSELTIKLDQLGDVTITQDVINEILLWKHDRYAATNPETLSVLNSLQDLQHGDHRNELARLALCLLLHVRGIALPMASTILRFRNPMVFQIIDQRAYRAIYGDKLSIPSSIERKVKFYFNYMDKLVKFCQERNLDFKSIDRLLYVFDKKINKKLKRRC